jgi:hypothetical protein
LGSIRLTCKIGQRTANRRGDMRGWIGRRKVNGEAAIGQCHGDCRRDGGFADASFAHREDDATSGLSKLLDKFRQAAQSFFAGMNTVEINTLGRIDCRFIELAGSHGSQGIGSEQPKGRQRHHRAGQIGEHRGNVREHPFRALLHRLRDGIAGVGRLKHAVDDEVLILHTELGEFAAGAGRFRQRDAASARVTSTSVVTCRSPSACTVC